MWNTVRPWLFPVWCVGCGAGDIALCARCAAGIAPVTVHTAGLPVRAAGVYESVLRDAVLACKRGERAFLEPLAAVLAPLVPARTILVPVVTTRRRAAERGYDQARELARRTALRCGGSVADVLRKHGPPQRGRARIDRLGARGRFAVRRGASLPHAAVLVDDVVTTGATLADAAATLRAAGVTVAGAIVVAHAPPERNSSRGA